MYNVKPGDGGPAMTGLLCGRLLALNGQTLSGLFVFAWQEPCPRGLYEARPARLRPGEVASCWSRLLRSAGRVLPGLLAA